MGASIAGLLIMGVFFTGALMMFRTDLFGNVLVGGSMKEATQISGDRARTIISITATTGDASGDLQVEIKNTGATPITDFTFLDPHMNVILQYRGTVVIPERLGYTSGGSPTLGRWTKGLTSTSDLFEPRIFNPGEVMIITAKHSATSGTTGTVTVGTPNGITDTACFEITVACP